MMCEIYLYCHIEQYCIPSNYNVACRYDYTSICLVSIHGHFCFFQFGPIMIKVAMNIKSFCGHKFLCLLDKHLGLGLPGHRVGKYLD